MGENVFRCLMFMSPESSPESSLRYGCGLHLTHQEINVNADFLLATPTGVLCTLRGVHAGGQCPGWKPRKDARLL